MSYSHFDYRNNIPTVNYGQPVVTEAYEPVDGGGQAVDIGSTANRSSALTVGALYHIVADVECYIVAGDDTVEATTSDYHLIPGFVFPFIAKTNKNYISVIRRNVDATGGLSICKVG